MTAETPSPTFDAEDTSDDPFDRDWRPILEGSDADRAWTAIRAIAEGIPPALDQSLDEVRAARQPSLAGGLAGIGVFYAYLAAATDDDRAADRAVEMMDRAAEILATSATPPELYSGFCGVAWCLEHLEGRLFESEDDGQQAIDEALLSYLDSPVAQAEFDIIRGLAGFGVYALERLPRPDAVAMLEKVVRALDATATRDETGAHWFSRPENLPEHQREDFPDGYINVGAAHGLPGVLPVLAGATAAGVAEDTAAPLLREAVDWLLAHPLDLELEEGGVCRFPYSWNPDLTVGRRSRLAWCYGDPGVAGTVMAAAQAAGQGEWAREALAIGCDAVRRPEATSGILDAGLCHGSAGLGVLFQRMAHLGTGAGADPSTVACLEVGARFWYRHALDFRDRQLEERPEVGVAGFPAWSTAETLQDLDWRTDPGFLTGSAGIGLALLSAVAPLTPDWDRVLGLSVAPPKA